MTNNNILKPKLVILNTDQVFLSFKHFLTYMESINFPLSLLFQSMLPIYFSNISVMLKPDEFEMIIEMNIEALDNVIENKITSEHKEQLIKFFYLIYLNFYIQMKKILTENMVIIKNIRLHRWHSNISLIIDVK